jgi:class 3 adenylate cyclase
MRLGSTALATERVERRLAATLAPNVAGYSPLVGADEEEALARLKANRRELIDPKISEHRGRIGAMGHRTRSTSTGEVAGNVSIVKLENTPVTCISV